MEKNVLKILLCLLAIGAAPLAFAQVYRYNPQTGGSENIAAPAPAAKAQPTAATPANKRLSASQTQQLQKAIEASRPGQTADEEGSSTQDLINAVNQNIATAQAEAGRKMLPLGRVGIIINPENYNATIERHIAELGRIPNLDKLYLTPPMHVGSLVSLMKWQKLSGIEFMTDSRNAVQQQFGITVPGFAYLRPDGTHTAYRLDDLAPFYEALAVQRRKVGK
jgi:hypothetical protein